MDTKTLVDLAEAYAAHSGLKLSTVSTYAATDGKFFSRLKGGAGCTLRKAAILVTWFSDNWPADLEWPRSIPRPPRTKKEAA
jgi:hypothetical protein